MGLTFESICPRHTLQYQPTKWCKRLGQKCDSCNSNLTHQKCVSLCKCYYFCHHQCIIPILEEQLVDEDTDVKCKKCEQPLKLSIQAHFKYSPSNSLGKLLKLFIAIIFLIISILGLILTLNSQLKPDIAFFFMYIEGLIISLLIYLTVIYTRDLLYVKIIRVREIISTKLEIQTSAFKDLDIQTNEQLTKDELIFQSKQSRE